MINEECKRECIVYFSEAIDLICKNGKVDDYDIVLSSGYNFNNIGKYKRPILEFTKYIYQKYGKCMCSIQDNKIVLLNNFGFPIYNFSFILSKTMSFAGVIGINEIKRDGGFSKHLDYLSCFLDTNNLNRMMGGIKNKFEGIDFNDANFFNEEYLISCYQIFYKRLLNVFESDLVAIFSLLSGIKHHYGLPDVGVYLDGDYYKMLDFTKLKSPTFINSRNKMDCSYSDPSPMLKIEFEGNKILHIRTKTESKNSTFRLKFFIETGHKFYDMFQITGEDYNG